MSNRNDWRWPEKILYTTFREYYRWSSKFISIAESNFNSKLIARYQHESKNLIHPIKKVYIHNRGTEWFYTSSIATNFSFELVDDPYIADLVVFITVIDKHIAENLFGKLVGFFFVNQVLM